MPLDSSSQPVQPAVDQTGFMWLLPAALRTINERCFFSPSPSSSGLVRRATAGHFSMLSQANNRCDEGEVTLEHVHGISLPSAAAFVSHPESGRLAYTAGCTIVIVNAELKQQTHLINSSKNEIVSLAFSADGNLIAAGESGLDPAVRLWDVNSKQEYAAFMGHKYSVPFLAFSPDKKYLVSVGNQNDQSIILWDVKRKEKLYPAQTASKVNALAFSPDSTHFVTVGVRFAKFWYIWESGRERSVHLDGSAPLGSTSKKTFTSVVYITSSYIVASTAKSLCPMKVNNNYSSQTTKDGSAGRARSNSGPTRWRLLDESEKKLDDTRMIFSLLVDSAREKLLVACSNGSVKILRLDTLQLLDSVAPTFRPHEINFDANNSSSDSNRPPKYGDTVAITWLGTDTLAAAYSNHSIYVWNVADLKQVERLSHISFHSLGIVNISIFPVSDEASGGLSKSTFATCSEDSTIRFWSNSDLVKVIYCDPANLSALCDRRIEDNLKKHNENEAKGLSSSGGTSSNHQSMPGSPTRQNAFSSPLASGTGSKWIVNVIAFRPDGSELAAGFRNGFVRIYDLATFSVSHESQQDAKEILMLAYSRFRGQQTEQNLPQLLALSGSDFQSITVLNATEEYATQQTCKSGHTSIINGLTFAQSEKDVAEARCWLISCSLDRLVIFHEADTSTSVLFSKQVRSVAIGAYSPHDLMINGGQDTIMLACHDRKVRLIDIASGRVTCSYLGADVHSKISHHLKRFDCDAKGSVLATVCSDKTISLLARPWDDHEDRQASEWNRRGVSERIFAMTTGHGSAINGIKFLPDGQHVVTASADSCIFSWKFDLRPGQLTRSASKRSRSIETVPSNSLEVARSPSPLLRAKRPLSAMYWGGASLDISKPPVARSISCQPIKERLIPQPSPTKKPAWQSPSRTITPNRSQLRKTQSTPVGNSKLAKAVESLSVNIDIICESVECLTLMEPRKKELLLGAVKSAARKLDGLVGDNKKDEPKE